MFFLARRENSSSFVLGLYINNDYLCITITLLVLRKAFLKVFLGVKAFGNGRFFSFLTYLISNCIIIVFKNE